MFNEIKKEILEKIKKYESIIIARHIRPDGDALGSTKGLKRIIELSFPGKKVYIASSDTSEYLSFLGPDDGEIDETTIKSSLAIICDTAVKERVSYKPVLNAKEIIRIDHHIKSENWGDIEWIEEDRSSCSELICDFYNTFKDILKLDKEGALALYTGIVTDSGRFAFSSTKPETLRMAALMLEFGFDIETLQARLDLKSYDFYRYRTALFERINIMPSGLGWVYVDEDFQKKWKLSREDASESVTFMSEIKGTICYLAFIDNGDGTIRVRLRSRFMKVNTLAEKYNGGGHDRASGAQCYSKDEMYALIKDADKKVREYKESHTGWI